jgi:hypothetical protein
VWEIVISAVTGYRHQRRSVDAVASPDGRISGICTVRTDDHDPPAAVGSPPDASADAGRSTSCDVLADDPSASVHVTSTVIVPRGATATAPPSCVVPDGTTSASSRKKHPGVKRTRDRPTTRATVSRGYGADVPASHSPSPCPIAITTRREVDNAASCARSTDPTRAPAIGASAVSGEIGGYVWTPGLSWRV